MLLWFNGSYSEKFQAQTGQESETKSPVLSVPVLLCMFRCFQINACLAWIQFSKRPILGNVKLSFPATGRAE